MLPPPLNGFDPGRIPSPDAEPVTGQATGAVPAGRGGPPVIRPLKDIEKDAIEQAIAYFDDNIPRAAAALGVSPSTIYRKRQTWGMSNA